MTKLVPDRVLFNVKKKTIDLNYIKTSPITNYGIRRQIV